jgi:malate dehydrogenase
MIGSNYGSNSPDDESDSQHCLYDPFGPALEGVAEELNHCAFKGVNITWTTDIREALTGSSYIVSSGGAPRKAGMTREIF